ncbi:YEATS domain-containing protein 2 [Desmophyllum pertusum]|uniref:YEATS domain-containing protein 2 n=1 Tax=Desmophyllum pertusum TaxID=174260 RepID=A0A9X0CI00_9CNID|nr:YEATS domain-containing protein 2 [Desmophyllum pertusum]
MENSLNGRETEDPDYESVSSERKREQGILSTRQQDAKEQAIQRMDRIIRQQFGFEIHLKEREIDLIDDRVSQAKAMLDRLRACVLAKYYGTSEHKGTGKNGKLIRDEVCDRKRSARNRGKRVECPSTAVTNHSSETVTPSSLQCQSETTDPFEAKKSAVIETLPNHLCTNGHLVDSLNFQSKKTLKAGNTNFVVNSDSSNLMLHEKQEKLTVSCDNTGHFTSISGEKLKPALVQHTWREQQGIESNQSNNGITQNCVKPNISEENPPSAVGSLSSATPMLVACTGSRFYIKKRIIIGNTSKYISIDRREDNDKSTHKWMVYVRGPPEDPNIDRFINKVWFFLHPSYRPNDIVEVNKPPFHLTRRGWGEFPVRVQLHFVDPRNKRVDIFHELKLDRTYTGLQTLGSETVVDLELDRRTFEDNCIPLTLSSKEESFSTDVLLAVSTNAKQDHGESSLDRSTVNNLHHHKNQMQAETALAAVRKFPSSSEILSQSPQVKKLKLESPVSIGSSAFSSTVSTPVNSLPASRCSSPELISSHVKVQNKLSDEVNELLRKAVKEHPLIDPGRNVVKHHYCASSMQQFLSWNIGKRRACEWQRAVAIRRRISTCMPSCKLSTKDVLVWCRRFGYTPCDKVTVDETNVSFCKLCGGCISVPTEEHSQENEAAHKCEEPPYTSLTPASDLCTEADVKEKCLPDIPQTKNDPEDVEIDVVGFIPEERKTKPQENKKVIYSIPPTPEQNWIRETCSDIGVKLKTVNTEGVDVHVIESLLLAACKGFAEDILRQSWACAADQTTSYGPRLVAPSHVHKAVCALPHCDFLSNAYLGEVLPLEEK